MNKKRLINLILLIIAVGGSLLFGEWVLRKIIFSNTNSFEGIKDPSKYAPFIKHKNGDFVTDDYWKLLHILKGGLEVKNPDGLMGWTSLKNSDKWINQQMEKCGERIPVLIYGDSFAQCVDSVDCYGEILNADTAFNQEYYFINFGVGGYGVDQIYLMMKSTIDEFKNPIVFFSILTTDMDRSLLSFRDSQKPFFELENEELSLRGVPIVNSTKEYLEKNPPEINSYLYRLLVNSNINFLRRDKSWSEDYMNESKKLNEMILDLAMKTLKENSSKFYFLLFHPAHHYIEDWRFIFMRNYLEENKINYFTDADLRLGDTTFETYNVHNYIIPHDGHPKSYYNNLVAQEMKNIVLFDSSEFLHPNNAEFYSEDVLVPKQLFQNFLSRKGN